MKSSEFNELDEANVLGGLARGEEKAFAEIYNHYRPFLYSVARRMLRSEDDAMDIIHTLFTEVWMRREQLVFVRDLKSYLFIAARNHIFNAVKKKARTSSLNAMQLQIADSDSTLSDVKLLEKQYEEMLSLAVSELPPQQRQVFHLSKESHLSHEEIGKQIGISTFTVKAHMRQALQTIRKKISPFLSLMLAFWSSH